MIGKGAFNNLPQKKLSDCESSKIIGWRKKESIQFWVKHCWCKMLVLMVALVLQVDQTDANSTVRILQTSLLSDDRYDDQWPLLESLNVKISNTKNTTLSFLFLPSDHYYILQNYTDERLVENYFANKERLINGEFSMRNVAGTHRFNVTGTLLPNTFSLEEEQTWTKSEYNGKKYLGEVSGN